MKWRWIALAVILTLALVVQAPAQSWIYSAAAEKAIEALLIFPGSCCAASTFASLIVNDLTANQVVGTNGSKKLTTIVGSSSGVVLVGGTPPTFTATPSITSLTLSSQLTSTLATGTAPFVIPSTTRVANLNVATSGTADALTTARTIAGVSFDGTANIAIPSTGLSDTGTLVRTTRTINTTSPMTGGGDLSADRTIACATCGVTGGPLSQFAATTSAQLAGIISDETGTGLLVFNTAPTFVTSVTGPLFIGGTGTTSTLVLRSTSGVGAAGADIIVQVGNNGATEAMRVLNNGNVGIGTASPAQKFHVAGSIQGDFGNTIGNIGTGHANNGSRNLAFGSRLDGVNLSGMRIDQTWNGSFNDEALAFLTHHGGVGTGVRMTIDRDGNVGIGTATPNEGLEMGAALNIRIPNIKSTTGVRFVCVDTNGTLVSQAASCVGT